MTKVGRNDPCPCGSGKKYKKCCLALDLSGAGVGGPMLARRRSADPVLAALGRLVTGPAPVSLDDRSTHVRPAIGDSAVDLSAPRTALARAQDVMDRAWESRGQRRVRLAHEALAISPDCADAHILLAEESASSPGEARDLFAKGIAAGERTISERFREDVGRFWHIRATQPYVRAHAGLALCLWIEGRHREAIDHWNEVLRLNFSDNMGIRYPLLAGLLEEGEDAAAEALLKRFRYSDAAPWAYGRALLAFRKDGDTPVAKRMRTKALGVNRHVPAYLIGWKKLPETMPERVGIGDESEAVLCAAGQRAAWRSAPGALEWLASAVPGGDQAAPLAAGTIFQLKVTLQGIRPPIWRRLLVPADTRLDELHDILQIVMGWHNGHLHEFEAGRRNIGPPDPDSWQEVEDEGEVQLCDVAPGAKARFTYLYDFGDSWKHVIVVEKVLPAEKDANYPACTAGQRACPPEDVGGIWGYESFLEAIQDPTRSRHNERVDWFGGSFDPEAFNVDTINAALRRLR